MSDHTRIDVTLIVESEEAAKEVMDALTDVFVADDRIESFDGSIEVAAVSS